MLTVTTFAVGVHYGRMRYVTVVAYPDEEGVNRLDRRVNELGLEYRAIHRMELLADDTVAMFAEGRGDVEGLRRFLSESPEVFEFSITGDEAGFFSYTRYAADDVVDERPEFRATVEMEIQAKVDANHPDVRINEQSDRIYGKTLEQEERIRA